MPRKGDIENFQDIWTTFLRRWHEAGLRAAMHPSEASHLADLKSGVVRRFDCLKEEAPPIVEVIERLRSCERFSSLSDSDREVLSQTLARAETETAAWFDRRKRKDTMVRELVRRARGERWKTLLWYPVLFVGLLSVFVTVGIRFFLLRGNL